MKLFNKDKQEDKGLVERIKQMYKQAYECKSERHTQWKDNMDAYSGEMFKQNLGSDRSDAIVNHIFSTIETVKPIMLSNYPKPIVIPKKEANFEKSMLVQHALEYEARRTDLFSLLLQALTQGLIFSDFIIGLFWDGKDNDGLGNVKPVLISPFNFFVDPMATSIKDAEYVMYATYKNVGEIIKAYPEKAEELRGNTTNNLDEFLSYGKENKDNARNQILYIEAYIRDYAVETEIEEELDDDGNKTGNKYKVTKMKYPKGRRVIIAGDVLLSDGDNPYNSGMFPFVKWTCYPMPNKFWGMGEVEPLISPQKHMIDLINDVIENANLCGNPVWILDKNCGVERNSLTNRKGLVVRKNPGTDVRREQPPSMPAYIQNMIAELKGDIQIISGVFDVTRGERPVAITAASAITALQEQSQSRIKLKVQQLEQTLSELYSMWLKLIQQFWNTPRTIRIFGDEYIPDSNQMMLDGKFMRLEEVTNDEIDGDFDIEILTGSTMPVNRSARLDQVIRLAQTMAEDGLPMIDRRTVLEYTELDNVEDIIKRFEEEKRKQQEQQQMEQQQQQQMLLEQQENKSQLAMQEQAMSNENEMNMAMMDNMAQLQQNALQEENTNVQSNVERDSLSELIQVVSKMSPEELQALFEERPDIEQLLQSVFEQPI